MDLVIYNDAEYNSLLIAMGDPGHPVVGPKGNLEQEKSAMTISFSYQAIWRWRAVLNQNDERRWLGRLKGCRQRVRVKIEEKLLERDLA